MARTPEGALLTEAHRQLQLRLNAGVLGTLLRLWGAVDPASLATTLDPFILGALTIVKGGRQGSAAAASRYYQEFRRVEGVRGGLALILPAAPPDAVIAGNLRGAALKGVQNGRAAGQNPAASAQNGYVKLAGSATSLVLGGGREMLMSAIHSDPEARGWQRVTDGGACAFCRMVASQGIIFKGEDSAGFEAHGHCGCSAEPAFEGSRISPQNASFKDEWNGATAGLSGDEALNAYRRSLSSGPE